MPLHKFIIFIVFTISSLGVNATTIATPPAVPTPLYDIHYAKEVNHLTKQLNPQNMWDDLTQLTTDPRFPDRSAHHESGKQAAFWIKDKLVRCRRSG